MGSMADKASGLARTRRSMTKRVERHPEKQRPKSKNEQERELSKELEMSFPASDPPSLTQPGGGITGPEVDKSDDKI
jgi:hypothetical protein